MVYFIPATNRSKENNENHDQCLFSYVVLFSYSLWLSYSLPCLEEHSKVLRFLHDNICVVSLLVCLFVVAIIVVVHGDERWFEKHLFRAQQTPELPLPPQHGLSRCRRCIRTRQ